MPISTSAFLYWRGSCIYVEQWAIALQSQWDAKQLQVRRIDWSKILDIGIDVDVDLDAEDIPTLAYEKWLETHLISLISGVSNE
ncbi:MAG TPA: hypothetical protein V6D19_09000 [Stenomitos sp.]